MAEVLKCLCFLTTVGLGLQSFGQTTVSAGGPLDPSRGINDPAIISKTHRALPEEYVWTAKDAAVLSEETVSQIRRDETKIEPRYFRSSFFLSQIPKDATVYIAGPRSAKVYLNGKLVLDQQCEGKHHFTFRTMSAPVEKALRPGKNVIAIEVVRGWGSHHHTNSLKTSWINSGEILSAKIVPAPAGLYAPALVVTNGDWRSTLHAPAGWEADTFEDKQWAKVDTLGSVEGDGELFQWNADTGMYAWPGYKGEAPYMANYRMAAARVEKIGDGQQAFGGESNLLRYVDGQRTGAFTVTLSKVEDSTGLLLDFGREVRGRVVIESGSNATLHATLQYGESLGELMKAPFLGINPLAVPPNGEAHGPKSAFRYAFIRFPKNEGEAVIRNIYLDGIYYPVKYAGSFESSDTQLNRVWEVGAYTAHLCMQDSLWDGAKRDSGRWIGDMEVIDRIVADVFGDPRLMKDALEQLLGPAPVTDHVNGLPGYSAWWIVAESQYYRRFGDKEQLQSIQARLLQLLPIMEKELDSRSLYTAASGKKPFVDWSKGFDRDSPEAQRAMHLEYLFAYREAAWLLAQAGDSKNSEICGNRANQLAAASQKYLLEMPMQTFGDRWQTNALAVLSGSATAAQKESIWSQVLSRTVNGRKPGDVITPYLGYYVLEAMAETGHRKEALAWIRSYWGGMLDAGATSFWEAYDPSYPKDDPHGHIEADNKVGYYASLAHAWAGGPTAWLMEQVLGIKPLSPGYRQIQIRPELADLKWAKGAMPTPQGLVHVSAEAAGQVSVDLPSGVEADILLPAKAGQSYIVSNTHPIKAVPVEGGTRLQITLRQKGHFVLAVQ